MKELEIFLKGSNPIVYAEDYVKQRVHNESLWGFTLDSDSIEPSEETLKKRAFEYALTFYYRMLEKYIGEVKSVKQ
jgi:hypothetical protein